MSSPNLHRRQVSNTLRISIPYSPSQPTSSYGSRRSQHSNSYVYTLISNKRHRRRIILTLVIFLSFLSLWSLSSWKSNRTVDTDKWGIWDRIFGQTRGVIDMNKIYKVERPILDRLKALEAFLGGPDEESEDYLRSIAKYGPEDGEEYELDMPPAVTDIPVMNKLKIPTETSTTTNAPASLPTRLPLIPASEIDPTICPPDRPCKFLLPAWLGEQETKAQQHLYQLGLLALSLNRTLVLPNVVRSRMGTCYSKPFSFYYETDSLERLGIPSISYDDFRNWTLRRSPPPAGQIISLTGSKAIYPSGAIEVDSGLDPALVPGKPSRNLCLGYPKTGIDFTTWNSLSIFPPKGWHKTDESRTGFGESVAVTLGSKEVSDQTWRLVKGGRPTVAPPNSEGLGSADEGNEEEVEISEEPSSGEDDEIHHFEEEFPSPDVLVFNFEVRFPILSALKVASLIQDRVSESSVLEFSHFPYSPTWVSLADSIADSLRPFITIHWRTETLTPSSLVPCASSLINKIKSLVSELRFQSIKTVYLATDYPIEILEDKIFRGIPEEKSTGKAHSGTFHSAVKQEHHIAMENFLRSFKTSLPGITLTTYDKEQTSIRKRIAADPDHFPSDLVEIFTPKMGSDNVLKEFDLSSLDSGLVGIVDKTVAQRATVFLTGLSGDSDKSCGKESSFTRQIIEARKNALEIQDQSSGVDHDLWNTVEFWSIDD